MKAFYVVGSGYNAVLVPQTKTVWVNPSNEDLRIFASPGTDFADWNDKTDEEMPDCDDIDAIREYWCNDVTDTIVAVSDDEGVTILDQENWPI